MEANSLDIILKETLGKEFSPSAALDKSTQLKMRKAVEQKQSILVISLSIISLIILSFVVILFLPQIPIISLKIMFMTFYVNISTLFIFFLIINNKNRKEAVL